MKNLLGFRVYVGLQGLGFRNLGIGFKGLEVYCESGVRSELSGQARSKQK